MNLCFSPEQFFSGRAERVAEIEPISTIFSGEDCMTTPINNIAERDDSKQQSIIISKSTFKFHLLSRVNVLS